VNMVAATVDYSDRSVRRYGQKGLEALARVLQEVEQGTYGGPTSQSPRSHLPPPEYVQLYGMDPLLRDTSALVLDPAAPPFISLEGIGGIGKTVLAQEVARQLARRGDLAGILWISARQEQFTVDGRLEPIPAAVRTSGDVIAHMARHLEMAELAGLGSETTLQRMAPLLLTGRYVIILDNLDTVPDAGRLLAQLARLVGPTRYLLTSRHTLGANPYVHVLTIPELSYEDSQALVRHELRVAGRDAPLSDPAMDTLYDTVGGLPLALWFVARQMGKFPLRRVLHDLVTVRGDKMENLLTFIYRKTWHRLDESAQHLLVASATHSSEGGDITWLRQSSSLSDGEFDRAVGQLLDHSLLQIRGSLQAPEYHYHPTTRIFADVNMAQRWCAGER
jgi:hypothetical protein